MRRDLAASALALTLYGVAWAGFWLVVGLVQLFKLTKRLGG